MEFVELLQKAKAGDTEAQEQIFLKALLSKNTAWTRLHFLLLPFSPPKVINICLYYSK